MSCAFRAALDGIPHKDSKGAYTRACVFSQDQVRKVVFIPHEVVFKVVVIGTLMLAQSVLCKHVSCNIEKT